MLWSSSAEGFVIISGFLIGYVRGYKGLKTSFTTIALKLIKRAAILYIAMILASIVYVAIEWSDKVWSMPYTPIPNDGPRDWGTIIWGFANLEHPHTWVHFLALYSIFLLLAVGAVWLLRRRQPFLLALLSMVVYTFGQFQDIQWMKWQLLFFIPAIAGFYFEALKVWWRSLSVKNTRTLLALLIVTTLFTLILSITYAFAPQLYATPVYSLIDTLFLGDLLWPPRIIIAFLWFIALALLFTKLTPWLKRWTGGILEYIGTHSLQAYLVHGLVICGIILTLPDSTSWFINTLYGLVAILAVWLLIRIPGIKQLLPR